MIKRAENEVNSKWLKLAYYLSILTILYNLLEGILSVFFGWQDESLTLFGFGIDSFIETISAIGILHLVIRLRINGNEQRDKFERNALRITGFAFFGLVITLLTGSILSVINKRQPESGFTGSIISLVSICKMWLLIFWKIKVGKRLKSDAIIADANCAKVCVLMSVVLFLSSLLYETFNWPYLDVAGSITLSWFSFKEGKECFEKANSDKLCSCDHH